MVNPSLIPTHLVGTWTQAAEADLQAPATTLGHLEEFLEAQARKLMLPILGAAAQALAGRQAFLCPICHRPLLAEAKNRRRTLATVFGSFCLQRDYGWCPRCAEYCAPADQALGLQPQAPASPRLQEIAALLSLRDPYAQAAKDAKQRVDLFRVKEHLYELAKTLYGEGTVQAQQWLKPLLRFLESRKEGALDVLHELQDLRQRLQGLTTSQQEKLEQEIGYFTTHHQRMDYKQAKANGEPVGSGPVESTAGQYQTRFKCTGQFWTLEGDEPLLALATLYHNERWHLLYPHAASTPNGSQNAQTQKPIKSNLALAGKPRQR